ncbi:MAG: hypothetical protein JWN50_372 [Parcubacteria group bacterium]|nr:hypothetical protein [Parcubacteria group bacterium]
MAKTAEELLHEIVPELHLEEERMEPSFWKLALEGIKDHKDWPFLLAILGVAFVFGSGVMSLFSTALTFSFTVTGLALSASAILSGWYQKHQAWLEAPYIHKALPTEEDVQRRMLGHMKSEIEKGKRDIVGEYSTFERHLAELKTRRDRADVIATYFRTRSEAESGNSELARQAREAVAMLAKFQEELSLARADQEEALAIFRDAEVYIPGETTRLTDERYASELRELQGFAGEAREVTREILMNAVLPTVERLILLHQVREKLLLRSLSSSPGVVDVDEFLGRVETLLERSLQDEKSLRKLGPANEGSV